MLAFINLNQIKVTLLIVKFFLILKVDCLTILRIYSVRLGFLAYLNSKRPFHRPEDLIKSIPWKCQSLSVLFLKNIIRCRSIIVLIVPERDVIAKKFLFTFFIYIFQTLFLQKTGFSWMLFWNFPTSLQNIILFLIFYWKMLN